MSQEEIEDYLKKYIWPNRRYAHLINAKKVGNFKVTDGKITCDIEYIFYTFKDFSLSESASERCEIEPTWLTFMYSKFGPIYKKTFLDFRAYNKSAAILEAEKKYDSETNFFAKSLDYGQEK
ncbi:MAG: hypothetical protein J5779_01365 [Clostridia bacterium]|nr:hypothetical protein [Clostridia bacterium]